MQWWVPPLLIGVGFGFWSVVGLLRLVSETATAATRAVRPGPSPQPSGGRVGDVAVVVPARNEQAGIAATVESVLRVVAPWQVHVIADGCTDRTATIARSYGVNVLELEPAQGKAGGIEAALRKFEIPERFAFLLICDADTRLDEQYVVRALRLFADRETVAVAGYAHPEWRPGELTPMGRFLVSYRVRLYALMQWLRYGQTWRWTNVCPIVPGFASMYRTETLARMDLNPPGLVIEDYNMTFEIHHRRLGRIAFSPSVFAVCQDPERLADYHRQIGRWWLGFWQTVRRHGLWPSGFCAALAFSITEVVLGSVVLLAIALSLLLLAVDPLSGGDAVQWTWFVPFYEWLTPVMTPLNLLLFLFVPDYVLTLVVAVWLRRPSLAVYGVGFVLLRLVDAFVTLRTIAQVWFSSSDGRWDSPARRPVPALVETAAGGAPLARRPSPVPRPRVTADQVHGQRRPVRVRSWRGAVAAYTDALWIALVVTLAVAAVVDAAVPVTVALGGLLLLVAATTAAAFVGNRLCRSRMRER